MRILPAATVLCALAATGLAQEVPRPAPDFEIEMPHGKKLSLRSLRGKIVPLIFLSTT